MFSNVHAGIIAVFASLLAAGCGSSPEFPVTQQSRPFTHYDAGLIQTAPDVARTVDGDRLTRARTEPHNWLTYYGAYDGKRFSTLDQINTANVVTLQSA